jgi:CMP-N,N'-diacetyllegionaminic acid synthase
MTIIALIPSRSGSKRVPGKNTRTLAGHPLLAYAIATAYEADIFDAVAVSSDDPATLEIAEEYGANRLILCPLEIAHKDDDPDIKWVRHALEMCPGFDAFAILRPTSPFRRGEWVSAAYDWFKDSGCDSLRAMRSVSEHPGKMWIEGAGIAHPLLPFSQLTTPWHSMPTQQLPRVLVQTAALEIANVELANRGAATISGSRVAPWITGWSAPGADIDINQPEDFVRAEQMAAAHPEWLPQVVQRVIA